MLEIRDLTEPLFAAFLVELTALSIKHGVVIDSDGDMYLRAPYTDISGSYYSRLSPFFNWGADSRPSPTDTPTIS